MVYKVFEKMNLGGMTMENRFIRSAAGSGVASPDGYVTPNVINWYQQVSAGKPSMIITEMMTVWDDSNFPENYLRIDDDTYIEGLRQITDIAHSNKVNIVAQLGNYGSLLHWPARKQPLGPSAIEDLVSGITAKEMTLEDLQFVIRQFIDAAIRSKEAGFDGVQVHAAHGFLINKFLSPYYNRRKDNYGGSISKRANILMDILEGIKKACGPDYPVLIKLNCSDFNDHPESFTFSHSLETSKLLSEAGYDGIEISGGVAGGSITPARSAKEIAYHTGYAKQIAEEVSIPVILVGGIRDLDVAEKVITETKIQAIGMTRALTYDPMLILKWHNGDHSPSKCIACNKCFVTDGQHCIFKK